MNDKSLKRNRKLHHQDYLIPFVSKTSLFCLTWTFNLDIIFKTIRIAARVFRFRLSLDALAIINQLKQ